MSDRRRGKSKASQNEVEVGMYELASGDLLDPLGLELGRSFRRDGFTVSPAAIGCVPSHLLLT